MKHVIKLFSALLILAIILPACKKDTVDLKNSYMDIVLSEEGLWAVDNDIRYVANLAPGTLTGEKVTITYTSEADPEGISIEAAYRNTELTFGRDVYRVQQIDRNFYVATETNADEYRLKVNPEGDKVTITIGDNLLTETVDFNKKYDPLIVSNFTISAKGCINGDIKYYNQDGDRPQIKLYSASNSSPITVSPNSDLGDNGFYPSDIAVLQDFGYTIYSASLVYDPENAPNYSNQVMINFESDILYVEIEGKTYSTPIAGEKIYQTIMAPAK